jgi:diamine N-acetyltransferase
MDVCLAEARSRGGDVVWLGVWEKNDRAIQFYQRKGFTVAGITTFQLGADLQHDLLMQRKLE